jgi:hypothetical protein
VDVDAPLGPQTTPAPPTGGPAPPPPSQQLCIQSGIKPQWYSAIGNHYCEVTCLFQQSYLCNLYLCYCNTKWYVEIPPGKAVDAVRENAVEVEAGANDEGNGKAEVIGKKPNFENAETQ